ncbi:MAG: flagellar motor switch protein FliG [Deltaproteobacteria bacterium]|nr:flagellar motor switch protein FliG [Deltaproteobacteria bacterium]MBW2069733.1 flagellar motor switch protein FliG [Deltaproteobacteria bacterium]
MATEKLRGPEKAALFLLGLGEEAACEVFKRLDKEEMKRLGETLATINQAPESDILEQICLEFKDIYEGKSPNTFFGNFFFRRTLARVLDKEADSFVKDMERSRRPKPFESLRKVDPQTLYNYIKNEHPQTIALVLANLPHQTAAEIVKLIPEESRADVVIRIARLEKIPAEVLTDIEKVLAEEITKTGEVEHHNLGGVQITAEIMNQLDQETESQIMGRIEEEGQELADEIRQLMFVFEDLVNVDDRGIRVLLKEISNDDLILALKTASETLKEKIFANLSERAAQMLREDMEVMGPAKLSDVERAQQTIITVARRLEEEGKIIVAGRGGEDLIV